MLIDLGIAFGRVAFVMLFVLNVAALLGWVERKQSAIMQDRIGANRASIFGFRALGLFHPLADTLKMLTKEDFRPARADRLLFDLAPAVSVFFALVAFASIPFGDTLRVAGRAKRSSWCAAELCQVVITEITRYEYVYLSSRSCHQLAIKTRLFGSVLHSRETRKRLGEKRVLAL